MIRVTKILGESYDLETGAETKKGLMLSNGISEVAVEVSDIVVDQVIQLMAEERQLLAKRQEAALEQAPEPTEARPRPRRNGRRKAPAAPPATFEQAEEQDGDPGEAYGDASSI